VDFRKYLIGSDPQIFGSALLLNIAVKQACAWAKIKNNQSRNTVIQVRPPWREINKSMQKLD